MAETKKRERNFERSYSDSTGLIGISHNEDTVAEVNIREVMGGATLALPSTAASSAMRYVTDILVGVGNAALKADGGTIEKAVEKMNETWAALVAGTFKFRAASGQGGLSDEEAQEIIAGELVSLGKFNTEADAMAAVTAIYNRTSKNAKGYVVRKDYNALKNVPQIKAALAAASKAESNVDAILAKVA